MNQRFLWVLTQCKQMHLTTMFHMQFLGKPDHIAGAMYGIDEDRRVHVRAFPSHTKKGQWGCGMLLPSIATRTTAIATATATRKSSIARRIKKSLFEVR